jgi:hypothetical protein
VKHHFEERAKLADRLQEDAAAVLALCSGDFLLRSIEVVVGFYYIHPKAHKLGQPPCVLIALY